MNAPLQESSLPKRNTKGPRKGPQLEADGLIAWRPSCLSCLRPTAYCVCGLVEPFRAHCNLIVLQHPNERRKYYSTVRIVKQAITNSRVLSGVIFPDGVLAKALENQRSYILFPGEDSVDCTDVVLDENSTVIVLDGTWSEAGKILRRNPILAELPRISFRATIESRYRIRKQPKAHCLSSLESIAHFLTLNADAQGRQAMSRLYSTLLVGFDRMVEQQLKHFPRFSSPAP